MSRWLQIWEYRNRCAQVFGKFVRAAIEAGLPEPIHQGNASVGPGLCHVQWDLPDTASTIGVVTNAYGCHKDVPSLHVILGPHNIVVTTVPFPDAESPNFEPLIEALWEYLGQP